MPLIILEIISLPEQYFVLAKPGFEDGSL